MYGFSASGLFGYLHIYGGYAGEQAEYVRVPFADIGPLKVPNELSDASRLFSNHKHRIHFRVSLSGPNAFSDLKGLSLFWYRVFLFQAELSFIPKDQTHPAKTNNHTKHTAI